MFSNPPCTIVVLVMFRFLFSFFFTNICATFGFAQTSFLNSRGSSSRSRLPDRLSESQPANNSGNSDRDRDNFSRWRDRQYFGPRRWLETALRDTAFEKDPGNSRTRRTCFFFIKSNVYCCALDNKKKDGASPLWISDELEFWPDSMGRFTQIATMYSELIALSSNGQLYQWKWNDPEPYKHPDVCYFFSILPLSNVIHPDKNVHLFPFL